MSRLAPRPRGGAGLLSRAFSDLADRGFQLRAAILADPGFQRWASRFPLTRGLARRRSAAMFDLVAGFVYSQVLTACVRLGVLEAIQGGAHTAAALAPRIDLSLDATRRLLDAAVALELLVRRPGDRYALGKHGTAYVGNPVVADMVRHHALLYRDLEDPVALLRGERRDTEMRRFWSYAAGGEVGPEAAVYSSLMARSVRAIADDLLEVEPFRDDRSLVDVAGGLGVFARAVAARAPHLDVAVFDLPAVAERARQHLADQGAGPRVRVVGGDLRTDPIPGPVDVVTLVRVLHDHDDADALRILRAARAALTPGGRLLVVEPMSGTPGAEAMGDAYFGFYLLAMGQGRPRTPETLARLCREAGLGRSRLRATRRPMLARLLEVRNGESLGSVN